MTIIKANAGYVCVPENEIGHALALLCVPYSATIISIP